VNRALPDDQAESLSLASRLMGMDVMVRNMMQMSGAGQCEAVRMPSITPAERVGMERDIGSLDCKRADVVVLDRALAVQRVFIEGVEFESSMHGFGR
jgi:N-acetylglucosamine-6-phosphate deacetylase